MKRELRDLLAEQPFMKGLQAPFLDLLAGCARNVRFKADEYIIREGRAADQFYLLTRGRVAIEIHAPHKGPVPVQTVEAGEVLGWSWLVAPYQWRFDGRAVEDVTALALDGACLRGKCEKEHELGYELLKRFAAVITQRLEATRLQLLDLYGEPV